MLELYRLNLASVGDDWTSGKALHNYTLCKSGQFLSEIHSVGEDALADAGGANLKADFGVSAEACAGELHLRLNSFCVFLSLALIYISCWIFWQLTGNWFETITDQSFRKLQIPEVENPGILFFFLNTVINKSPLNNLYRNPQIKKKLKSTLRTWNITGFFSTCFLELNVLRSSGVNTMAVYIKTFKLNKSPHLSFHVSCSIISWSTGLLADMVLFTSALLNWLPKRIVVSTCNEAWTLQSRGVICVGLNTAHTALGLVCSLRSAPVAPLEFSVVIPLVCLPDDCQLWSWFCLVDLCILMLWFFIIRLSALVNFIKSSLSLAY